MKIILQNLQSFKLFFCVHKVKDSWVHRTSYIFRKIIADTKKQREIPLIIFLTFQFLLTLDSTTNNFLHHHFHTTTIDLWNASLTSKQKRKKEKRRKKNNALSHRWNARTRSLVAGWRAFSLSFSLPKLKDCCLENGQCFDFSKRLSDDFYFDQKKLVFPKNYCFFWSPKSFAEILK